MSGDRSAAAYANDEAVISYQQAVDLLGEDATDRAAAPGLWAKLARVHWRLGEFDESRHACGESTRTALANGDHLRAAKSLWLLGAVETAGHSHERAQEAFTAAEAHLQACADKEPDEWGQAWIDVQMERANLDYWLNEPEKQAARLEAVRPVVQERATARQKANFYSAVALQRSRASRYLINEGIKQDYLSAWASVVEAHLQGEMNWVRFSLGMTLLIRGDLADAQVEMEAALDVSRRAGDKTLVLRCLVYLALLGLRRHDVEAVKQRVPETVDLARSLGFPECEGLANAALGWVAWKEGRPGDVEALAGQARELWQKCVVHYFLYWAALWPLIAVLLSGGRFDDAIAAARELLGPTSSNYLMTSTLPSVRLSRRSTREMWRQPPNAWV